MKRNYSYEAHLIVRHLQGLSVNRRFMTLKQARRVVALGGGKPSLAVKALKELETDGCGRYERRWHDESRFVFTEMTTSL